jgi:hypothetical protein
MEVRGELHSLAAMSPRKDTPIPTEWEAGLSWLRRRVKSLVPARNSHMIPQFSLYPNDYTSSFVLAAVPLISLPILLQWNDKTDILHMKMMVSELRVPMTTVSGLCPLLF